MSDGPLRVDEFLERALYDPAAGFYGAGRGRAGRRGDFLTSPEVGPLFGAVLARAIEGWWDEAGRPDGDAAVTALLKECRAVPGRVDAALADFDFRPALQSVWGIVEQADRCIDATRPWELARAEAREAVGRTAETLDAVVKEEHTRLDDRDGWRKDLNDAKRRVEAAVADLVNELLDRRDLYENGTWPGIEGEALALAQRGTEQLTDTEVRRLNRRVRGSV